MVYIYSESFLSMANFLHRRKLTVILCLLLTVSFLTVSATLRQMGIADFLPKPLDQSELFNCILNTLGSHKNIEPKKQNDIYASSQPSEKKQKNRCRYGHR